MDVKAGRSPPTTGQACAIADPQRLALEHMLAALRHLDNDVGVSPFVGAQLQLAIDRLAASTAGGLQANQRTPPRSAAGFDRTVAQGQGSRFGHIEVRKGPRQA